MLCHGPPDALEVDSTNLSTDQVVEHILRLAREKQLVDSQDQEV